jgi:hypothetical protein
MAFLFALSLIPTAIDLGMTLAKKEEKTSDRYEISQAERDADYALAKEIRDAEMEERMAGIKAKKQEREYATIYNKEKAVSDQIKRQRQIQQQELHERSQREIANQQRLTQQLTANAISAGEAQKKAMEEQKQQLQRRSSQQSDAFKLQLAQQKAMKEASMKALTAQSQPVVQQPRRVRAATRYGRGYDADTLNFLKVYYGISLSKAKKIYKTYLA